MDVAEFFSGFRRMCKSSSDCAKCEYHGDRCDNVIELLEKTVAVVEQWSLEHPRKTRQDVFLEQWPNAKIYDNVMTICPKVIDISFSCRMDCLDCYTCRQEFWMKDVE
jgi:hypothetical protein